MADTTNATPNAGNPTTSPRPPRPNKNQLLNKIYSLPAPLRTFPLPTFVPDNPISWLHILYVCISQAIKPQNSHYENLYQGWFSQETRSVHITDPRSIRGVWEYGFYGKGSLSRSEPSWLDREKARRGTKSKKTSEENTQRRRAERQQTKWERARKEREAIEQKLTEEAEQARSLALQEEVTPEVTQFVDENLAALESISSVDASEKLELVYPVGPLELLSLPNSEVELELYLKGNSVVSCTAEDFDEKFIERFYSPPVGPLELLALPNSLNVPTKNLLGVEDKAISNGQLALTPATTPESKINGALELASGYLQVEESDLVGGSETNDDTVDGSTHSEDTIETSTTAPNGSALIIGSPSTPRMKRQKSVRFSPTVEKNTFIQTEPPSPDHGAITTTTEENLVIKEQEHTQLTLEEAFFLSYGLGALEILDPDTKRPIPNKELFTLFRRTSYFPPVANQSLSPDDPFMINYVAYHHFRSLGWVPRSGVKFSVDLMLYVRGPVFTHAEFGVLVLPSYSHPHWNSDVFLQNYVKSKERRTWTWVSCINRVITQVKKTLILAYVDIPPPLEREKEEALGVDGILARYKVKEIVMKRWVGNRSRD